MKIRRKITILLIMLLLVISVSSSMTYAYFRYKVENTSTITGTVVGANASVTVTRVVGNDNEMVPLQEEALSNALNGSGISGTTQACIDDLGRLSCEVFSITVTNNGSKLSGLKGTITLFAKNTSSSYTDLKWKRLDNTTTVNSSYISYGMSESTLISNLTLEAKESVTYYIAVWLDENDTDQISSNYGQFTGTVKFEVKGLSGFAATMASNSVPDNVASTYVSSSSGINFNQISSNTNGKGIYEYTGEYEGDYPIYYYRGAVTDNNVLFGDYCFKIVRTTETGGIKMIYNGLSGEDYTCNNSGASTLLTISEFNSNDDSIAYVGYMYGTVYNISSMSISSDYTFSSNVSYNSDTGKYNLIGTTQIAGSDWNNQYNNINNTHYVCITDSTCGSVDYVFYTTYSSSEDTIYYITLTGGKKVEDAISEMLNNNTTSSTIKGDSVTPGTIDYWYYNYFLTDYGSYLEDTVFCNDRSIYSLGGFNPDGGDTSYELYFGVYGRIGSSQTPSLVCSRNVDKFSVSSTIGNGALDYPVGLISTDEVILSGGYYNDGVNYGNSYLVTGVSSQGWYWTMSPYSFNKNGAYLYHLGLGWKSSGDSYVFGILTQNYASYNNNKMGVRPVVSLKPGTDFVSGDGTANNHYVVQIS